MAEPWIILADAARPQPVDEDSYTVICRLVVDPSDFHGVSPAAALPSVPVVQREQFAFCIFVERLRVEIIAGPIAQVLVQIGAGICQHAKQVGVSAWSTAVLRWPGPRTVDNHWNAVTFRCGDRLDVYV